MCLPTRPSFIAARVEPPSTMEIDRGGLPDTSKIAADVLSPIPEIRLEAVRKIRQLLSIGSPPIGEVIESGVLPELVSFLGNDDDHTLQFEAAWLLTNVASETSNQTRALVDAKAIPGFVHLLCSKNGDLREQSIWALGNIAGDCSEFRDRILEGGDALKHLLHCIITSSKLALVKNAIWTVSNLCRGKPAPSFSLVSPAIPVLALCLSSKDDEILIDVCWSLAYLSDGTIDRIEMIVKSHHSVIPQLVELMESESVGVRVPALRTIGNLLTSDNHTQSVLDYPRALPVLKNRLNDPRNTVRKEACWAFSNITAGSVEHIQMVIENGVVSVLVDLVEYGRDSDVKKEAVWALSNMVSGGKVDQIMYLVEQNILAAFVSLLEKGSDEKGIIVSLEGIKNVLECGRDSIRFGDQNPFVEKIEENGGLVMLLDLQMHRNPQVHERASSILEKYFSDEEEEDSEGDIEIGSSR